MIEGREILGLNWRVPLWFESLGEQVLGRLDGFARELQKFNTKLNLVSAKTIKDFDLLHFSDSLLASELIFQNHSKGRVFDLGSGNGFPGIVMGILKPDVEVILADRDQRKCEFMKHVITTIGLRNVRVALGPLETTLSKTVEVGVSRGFAPLGKALVTLRKAMAPNGVVYFLKGPQWNAEILGIPTQVCSLWKIDVLGSYELPSTSIGHQVVRCRFSENRV